MFKKQQGASFFGILIVLIMVGTFITIAFKIYQPYLDHMAVKAVLEGVSADHDEIRKPIPTIRADIAKRLLINQVTIPTPQESLSIENDKGVLKMGLNYEVRVPMFFNIDAVIKFSEQYEAVIP